MDNLETMPTMAVTRNYSLTMAHIARVADLAQRLGVSQGEVVRRAIDLLYAQIEEQETQNGATPA